MRRAFIVIAAILAISPVQAAGDFPLASCKGWDGTVTERDGIDTSRASMRGTVTKADLQEYCERDPGGETRAFGGKLTKTQCVDKYLRSDAGKKLVAEANCGAGTVSYSYGDRPPARAKFPLKDDDTSCASGMPPLMGQFKMLCPTAAKRLKLP